MTTPTSDQVPDQAPTGHLDRAMQRNGPPGFIPIVTPPAMRMAQLPAAPPPPIPGIDTSGGAGVRPHVPVRSPRPIDLLSNYDRAVVDLIAAVERTADLPCLTDAQRNELRETVAATRLAFALARS